MTMHCAKILSSHFHALLTLVTPMMALTVLVTTNVLTNLVATILSAPIPQVLPHATAPLDMKEMPSQDALILTNVQLKPMSVMLMLHVPIHSDLMTEPVMPVIPVMAKYVMTSMNVMMTISIHVLEPMQFV